MSLPRKSFRRSLALGLVLLALAQWGLAHTSLAPVSFFGGRDLALKYGRLSDLDDAERIEVIAVGPSFVNRGFDAERFTELTGKTTANMGVPGTDMYFQSLFVRHVLIPLFEPETILWGVRDATRSRSGINHQYVTSRALRHARWPFGAQFFDLERRSLHFKKRRLTEWYEVFFEEELESFDAHGNPYRAPLKRTPRARTGERRGQSGRGAVVEGDDEDDAPEDSGARRGSSFLSDTYAVEEGEARRAFEETLAFAAERDVRIVFFLTPYFESTFQVRSNYTRRVLTGEYASFHGWLEQALEDRGVPLVNLRYLEGVSEDPAYFFDSRHLNQLGAVPTTAALAEVYLGERTIPDAWGSLPSGAEVAAMLGTVDRDAVPRFPATERLDLAFATRVEAGGQGTNAVYARLDVDVGGTYRPLLVDRTARARTGSYFVRLGKGRYRVWAPSGLESRADPRVAALPGFTLDAGEHLFELHRRSGSPIDWDELVLVPVETEPAD